MALFKHKKRDEKGRITGFVNVTKEQILSHKHFDSWWWGRSRRKTFDVVVEQIEKLKNDEQK